MEMTGPDIRTSAGCGPGGRPPAGIAVFVSGGGTNLQALLDAEKAGRLKSGRISLVVADRPGAYGLERAAAAGVPALLVNRRDFADKDRFNRRLLEEVREKGIELVVLAGFLSILSEEFIRAYPDRVVNVHPSLIPAFCGDGFYGLKVHEAALARGVKLTGATVHFVNEITDGGRIIAQKAVPVKPGDTPQTLQRRVMEEAEWQILPAAVEEVCREITGIQNKENKDD